MAIQRTNPLSIEAIGEIPVEANIPDQLEKLVLAIKDADEDREDWLNKQLKLTKLRFGIRQERNIPWKNASNISIPLMDSTIRKWRPGISSLVLDADPIAYMTPQEASDFEPARLVEPFFTWLVVTHMQIAPEVIELVDLIASRGHAYSREGWKYRTHRRARVVNARSIWPGGVREETEAELQALAAQGVTELPSMEQLVAARLAEEYGLVVNDPVEGPMLFEAALQLLGGAEFVRVTYREVREDRPDWTALDPINVIAPPDEDPEQAAFVCILHDMTRDKVAEMSESGIFNTMQAANTIDRMVSASDTANSRDGVESQAGSTRESILDVMNVKAGLATESSRRSRKTTPIWEIFCHLQLQPGTTRVRCVGWYAPEFKIWLALTEFVLPFDVWPITPYRFNRDGRRMLDTRGICEMLVDFQRITNAQHNARLDAAQILLSPVFKVKASGEAADGPAINWRPGGKIPLRNPEKDLIPLVHDLRLLGELLQEEQVSQRLAETYVGTFDSTLTNLEQSRERRTAREVSAIQEIAGSIFGLDAKLFQVQFSRSLNKLWQLYEEYGQEELFFRVAGEEKPRLARKSEISKNYDIVAAGTPANTNRALVIDNIERVMPILLNPQIMGTGVVDVGELIRAWLTTVDFKLSKKVIRSPEQAAAVQRILQAAQIASEQTGQEAPAGL
jgi:hypothetical protein